MPFWYLGYLLTSRWNFKEIVPGKPRAEYSDFGPKERYFRIGAR